MRVLLVNPWSILKYNMIVIPNIGLGYLASALRDEGHTVTIVDCVKERIDGERFKRYIQQQMSFDVIGFSVFTSHVTAVKQYAQIVKRNSPNSYIVVGGVHPTLEPTQMIETIQEIDFSDEP